MTRYLSKTAWVDEVVFWLGHVESRALESDSNSNFRFAGVHADFNSLGEPGANKRLNAQVECHIPGSPTNKDFEITKRVSSCGVCRENEVRGRC
jgi:hypothetical protein